MIAREFEMRLVDPPAAAAAAAAALREASPGCPGVVAVLDEVGPGVPSMS